MREIKFRGINKETGEFVYGDLINREKNFKPTVSILDWSFYEDHVKEILPESAGQYTGLKDKNGVAIYEGDIVYCRDGNGHVVGRNDTVKYKNQSGCYWLRYRDIPLYKFEIFYAEGGTIDVIGNIHQNPELLTHE